MEYSPEELITLHMPARIWAGIDVSAQLNRDALAVIEAGIF
jgi:hypothetical protein